MREKQPNNPLHGITLEQIITTLVEHYGWGKLSTLINIQCFHEKVAQAFLPVSMWHQSPY